MMRRLAKCFDLAAPLHHFFWPELSGRLIRIANGVRNNSSCLHCSRRRSLRFSALAARAEHQFRKPQRALECGAIEPAEPGARSEWAAWQASTQTLGLEVAGTSSRSADGGTERVVYYLRRLSDHLNGHHLNAVVAVTEPIPFSLIRLSITG